MIWSPSTVRICDIDKINDRAEDVGNVVDCLCACRHRIRGKAGRGCFASEVPMEIRWIRTPPDTERYTVTEIFLLLVPGLDWIELCMHVRGVGANNLQD